MKSVELYANNNERSRMRALLASFVLWSALTAGCSDESDPAEQHQRNAPQAAPYSLETNPNYYRNLLDAQSYITEPAASENLRQLQETPIAHWLDDTTSSDTIRPILQQSALKNSIPVFVAYNILNRDIGSESSGGFTSANAYTAWVQSVSNEIADSSAIVILEPDALAHLPDINDDQARAERINALRQGLAIFATNKNTAVYLDAGNSAWHSAETTAQLLNEITDTNVRIPGISLNISNFRSEEETIIYAENIRRLTKQEDLYVIIDNSRNGAPNTNAIDQWCNPPEQHLGEIDDTSFDPKNMNEEIYIKTPGESDGVCGVSSKPAGEFDGELLIRQLR